jgi:parallel beta-helix repeat protein
LILLLATGFFLLREKRSLGLPPPVDQTISSATTFDSIQSGGVFTVTGNLTMTSGGSITCNNGDPGSVGANACDIKIVVGGNMLMENGSKISASASGGGHGGNITITVGDFSATPPTGDFTMQGGQPGSQILVNSATGSAGAIVINVAHIADVDGLVQSKSGLTGTGANQAPGGGPITINAGCNLTVSDTGVVSSEGRDPGADLVHLQACVVEIDGLVQSFGPGHAVPVNPINHCDHANRPDKPANSTGCVEIWAGDSLTLDSVTHNGQINADIGLGGQVGGRGWIDMFARGPVLILGDTSGTAFDVHSNQGGTNGFAGIIHVASLVSSVTASGTAFQVDDLGGGSKGGSVTIEAALNVTLDDAQIFARGDFAQSGGFGNGGQITGQSFAGALSWINTASAPASIGDVRPTGADTIPPVDVSAPSLASGKRGVITLTSCTAAPNVGSGATATSFPFNGDTPTTPTLVTACAVGPTLQPYVVLPPADCGPNCLPKTPTPTPTSTKTTTPTTVTPTVTPTPSLFCNKTEVLGVLAGRVPDVIVRTDLGKSIQAAVDTASDTNGDGFIIIGVASNGTGALGGSTHQSVVISQVYTKPFLLFGCSVTMIDPTPSDANPTGWIKSSAGSPGNIFVMDLHGTGSDVAGWKVEGNGRTLRNVENNTSGVGAWFLGNNNTMHNGKALNNTGVGVLVSGDGNVVTDTLVEFNKGNGIEVHGNNNQILKTQLGDISKGNLGDGLNVSGNGNTLRENTARANTLDGIHVVTGTGNTLTKNLSGGTLAQNNGGCEYEVVFGNINGAENKANNVLVPGVAGSPFPPGCIE